MQEKALQWHPGFQAELQIELRENLGAEEKLVEKESRITQFEDEKRQAMLLGIAALTEVYKELGWSERAILGKISEKLQLSQEQIYSYVENYCSEDRQFV